MAVPRAPPREPRAAIMSTSPQWVRCPLCGHQTPVRKGRDFITCTCGLLLATQPPPAPKPARKKRLFGLINVG
jgi:hypothetical protein